MIIASLILASVLPCAATPTPHVTFAQPGSPNYIAMTHIRRLPAELCETFEAAPLVGEPLALLDVPAPPFEYAGPPLYVIPGSPLLWTPMDWPPDEIAYGGGGAWFGGNGGGGIGGVVLIPLVPVAPPVPEPSTWVLLWMMLVASAAALRVKL